MPAPRPHPARALVTLVAAASLAACRSDDLTLGDAYGTYVLESPAGVSATAALVTDTMWLFDGAPTDGGPNWGRHKTTSLVQRAAAPGSTPDSLVIFEQSLRFDVDGDEVLVTYLCPPYADCLAGPHLRGPLDGDILVLRPRPEMSSSARTYRRVARGGD